MVLVSYDTILSRATYLPSSLSVSYGMYGTSLVPYIPYFIIIPNPRKKIKRHASSIAEVSYILTKTFCNYFWVSSFFSFNYFVKWSLLFGSCSPLHDDYDFDDASTTTFFLNFLGRTRTLATSLSRTTPLFSFSQDLQEDDRINNNFQTLSLRYGTISKTKHSRIDHHVSASLRLQRRSDWKRLLGGTCRGATPLRARRPRR